MLYRIQNRNIEESIKTGMRSMNTRSCGTIIGMFFMNNRNNVFRRNNTQKNIVLINNRNGRKSVANRKMNSILRTVIRQHRNNVLISKQRIHYNVGGSTKKFF